MRALFLMLLLANLLFLAWAKWIAPPAPLAGQATPSAPDRRAIRLLREAPAPGEAGSATPGTGGVASTLQEANCVSAGPYLERAQAETASSQLQRLGFNSRLRSSTDDIRVGDWVRVPNLATPDDAANALAALKAAGLSDAEIVSEDPPSNTISLGVFGEPARAADAAEVARRAGFTPEVSPRTRATDVFWLDIDRLENGSLPGLDAIGPAAGVAAPPLELRACPAAAAPAG